MWTLFTTLDQNVELRHINEPVLVIKERMYSYHIHLPLTCSPPSCLSVNFFLTCDICNLSHVSFFSTYKLFLRCKLWNLSHFSCSSHGQTFSQMWPVGSFSHFIFVSFTNFFSDATCALCNLSQFSFFSHLQTFPPQMWLERGRAELQRLLLHVLFHDGQEWNNQMTME